MKLLALIVCVSATVSASVQSFPDERYKIRVQLPGGQSLRGGQELAALLATTSDQNSVYNLPPPLLQRNAIYQLQVTITDPNGMESSYTRSPRLKYEAFNCLTVTPAGMLHVTPLTGAVCSLPNNPQLWVVLTDIGGNPIAMNEYLFSVTD